MHVLVTGCGGFLGREIVRQLLRRGDTVTGISRGTYPELVNEGMQHVCGDLTDAAFCLRSIRDVDAVIHTAAVAGVWGPWEHFYSINKLATDHVIAACQANQIRHLVYTSSPSVTFDSKHQQNLDESAPYPTTWLCHYPHTKAMAEQAVLAAHSPGKLNTVALRPHLIWGDDDPHIIPRILDRARRGRLRIVGDGTNQVDTVHVINAAAAHLDALDSLDRDPNRGGGRAYFIAQDEPVNCWDWICEICEMAGVTPPKRKIRYETVYRIGAILESVYRILGRKQEPPMTRFVAAQLAKDHYFDISAAKERLGYRVRITMDEGLESLRKSLEK
ncbi:NAD-dependent epimerase/dehydratase family protein [Novipirellula caenicola]|uniref:2-alkyl-3-oxoalkanoate reductase n=1 Tax=Novipirellula caenicola TaxID=1536901 RepID=A0ABP9W0W3_9BACT